MNETVEHLDAVNRAFTAQSEYYDQRDLSNPILQDWRLQVYKHVGKFLKPGSRLLELNAGTGIDAVYFAKQGHQVLATDISDGMIEQLNRKTRNAGGNLRVMQLSYENLYDLQGKQFDYVFSNFGGLNCLPDLTSVVRGVCGLLVPGGCVTWVVMPPTSPWELAWALNGNWKLAGRRWKKNGTVAHVEGAYFKTYYHSLRSVRRAFGPGFTLIEAESLGVFSPPPSRASLVKRHPRTWALLNALDHTAAKIFPFNRIGDHLIVTFRRNP